MGCTPSTKNHSINSQSDRLCKYSRTTKIVIKQHDNQGNALSSHQVVCVLSEPISITSEEVKLGYETFQISSCMLPGLDPRGEYKKKCQDNCFYLVSSSGILCCLFDGHGTQGEKVAQFCEHTIEAYFNSNKMLIEKNPLNFLKLATERCDKALASNNENIDSEYSGCTGVLIYITETTIYSGSVGDSRGIIVTTTAPAVLPAPPANLGTEREVLASVKIKRRSFIETQIQSIQLTKDQKPEDPEELQRITKAGGRVQRLTDYFGNNIGPYRVWKKNSNVPGLAMSRSIGDMIAKNIGVISEPVCTTYNRAPGDMFIVIASDGVWDAMDNEDVGTFVECFRNRCKTGANSFTLSNEISPKNACIAQIVCEEARMRWFTIVEEEDVMIDDISCIVLEIKQSIGKGVKHLVRPLPVEIVADKIFEEEHEGLRRAPTLKEIEIRDPRRGSLVSDKIEDFNEVN